MNIHGLGMVAHTTKPSTWEAEADGCLLDQGSPCLQSKFQYIQDASMTWRDSVFKNRKEKLVVLQLQCFSGVCSVFISFSVSTCSSFEVSQIWGKLKFFTLVTIMTMFIPLLPEDVTVLWFHMFKLECSKIKLRHNLKNRCRDLTDFLLIS